MRYNKNTAKEKGRCLIANDQNEKAAESERNQTEQVGKTIGVDPSGPPGRSYRDVTVRYCTKRGENVVVERRSDGGNDRFVCLNPGNCGGKCDNFS